MPRLGSTEGEDDEDGGSGGVDDDSDAQPSVVLGDECEQVQVEQVLEATGAAAAAAAAGHHPTDADLQYVWDLVDAAGKLDRGAINDLLQQLREKNVHEKVVQRVAEQSLRDWGLANILAELGTGVV